MMFIRGLFTILGLLILCVNSQWSTWTTQNVGLCSSSCVRTVTSSRQCRNSAASGGTTNCTGSNTRTIIENCKWEACRDARFVSSSSDPVDGGWSVWTTTVEGTCNASCSNKLGTVTITRTRFCNNPVPKNGGRKCVGNSTEITTESCEAPDCPVDGGWSPWTVTVGLCLSNCYRLENGTRNCTNPPPQRGGVTCSGVSRYVMDRKCTGGNCPENSSTIYARIFSVGNLVQIGGPVFITLVVAGSILSLVFTALCMIFINHKHELRHIRRMEKMRERKRRIRFGSPELIPLQHQGNEWQFTDQ
ncbi:coadhesin-like [Gigantopelta aegis]|uniref:coadhesin-like n=1 Tax=Gigantopelta aegis TaxID=1735272 RepID=UPI001B88DAAD|nr:coadhesin-like [Gigantopelta aegis]